MKHKHYTEIPLKKVDNIDVKGVSLNIGISLEDGAPNYVMRLFHVEAGGHTPFHKHPWEHEVFIVSGNGTLVLKKEQRNFRIGDFIFLEPGILHQFKNTGTEELQFICVVPKTATS